MKDFFLIAIVLVFSINLYGQQDLNIIQQNLVKELTDKAQLHNFKKLSKIDISSIYLYKNWQNDGRIYTNSKKYKLNNINYNLLSDTFDARMSKDSIYTFDLNSIDSVRIDNSSFRKFKNLQNKISFFEMIYSKENIFLLKKHGVRINKGKRDNFTGKVSEDKYYKIKKYFILKDESMSELKLTKKDVIALVKDKRKEIELYVRKNKLSYKKERDVVQILQQYVTL